MSDTTLMHILELFPYAKSLHLVGSYTKPYPDLLGKFPNLRYILSNNMNMSLPMHSKLETYVGYVNANLKFATPALKRLMIFDEFDGNWLKNFPQLICLQIESGSPAKRPLDGQLASRLQLFGTRADSDSMLFKNEFANLEYLILSQISISVFDKVMEKIASLPKVKYLEIKELDGHELSDKHLLALKHLVNVKQIRLNVRYLKLSMNESKMNYLLQQPPFNKEDWMQEHHNIYIPKLSGTDEI